MGLEFSTRIPPNIQRNSRFIAIYEVADYEGESEQLPSSSEVEMPSSSTTSSRKTGIGNLIYKTALFLSMSKKMKQKGTVQQQGRTSPLEDECFFSDYLMFYRLFHGIGRWIKILRRVSGNWLSLMLEQKPANAGSCANPLKFNRKVKNLQSR